MGREAALSGEMVTWEELYFSNAKLDHRLDLSQFDK
jgi:hypothetical protein